MSNKICTHCNRLLDLDDFYQNSTHSDNRDSWCKKCKAKLRVKWAKDNPDKEKERQHKIWIRHGKKYNSRSKRYHARTLLNALNIYGCRCQHCGNDDITVLQWHHCGGRKGKSDQRAKLLLRIVKVGRIIEDVMLLCANCHIHQDIKEETSIRGNILSVIKGSENEFNFTFRKRLVASSEQEILEANQRKQRNAS